MALSKIPDTGSVNVCGQWLRPGAEFGGDGQIFRGPKFLNDVFFGKNFHFHAQFTRKSTISEKNSLTTPISLLCSSFRTRPTTLLLKILGGTNAWAVPHLKFWGTVPPVPSRSPPLSVAQNIELLTHALSGISLVVVGRKSGGWMGNAS